MADDGPLSINTGPTGGLPKQESSKGGSGKGPLAKKRDTIKEKVENKIIDSLQKGGPIKKTGAYKLHAGERVLNKKQAKSYSKRRKRSEK
jgi:hypothetical protein